MRVITSSKAELAEIKIGIDIATYYYHRCGLVKVLACCCQGATTAQQVVLVLDDQFTVLLSLEYWMIDNVGDLVGQMMGINNNFFNTTGAQLAN